MGASASVQQERQVKKPVKAQNVRQRLHSEYGGDDLDGVGEGTTGIRMAEVPALLKARRAFLKNLKTRKETTKESTNIVKKQDNHALLKEIFHRIDPASVNSLSSRVVGEIEIALKYKSNEATLLVRVGRAKNLENVDLHNLPNPFAQAELIIKRPEAQNTEQVQRTISKSNTANPHFQEILIFSLEQKDLVDAKLKVSIWNKDSISQNDFLGEVILELYKEEVNGGVSTWYRLQPETDLNITGKLEITLDYIDEKLMVYVHQAFNLKTANGITHTSNPYVRCYVTGISKKEETKVVEDDINPVFDEIFQFEVPAENCDHGVLVLNVLSKEVVGKDKRLGDIHLPLSDVNFQQAKRVTHDLADLRNTPHTRSKWSEEGISQEFREAMRAHAIYRYPHCIFQGQHAGRKLVTVSCTKARSSAKMTIVNGFPLRE